MQKALFSLFVAVLVLSGVFPVMAATKTTPIAPSKVVSTTVVTKVVKKPVVKPIVKKVVVPPPVKKKVVPAPTKPAGGAIAAVSTSAVSVPVSSCMQAIAKANKYCASIAKGCPSNSTSAKCVAANEKCEEQQNAALESCPTI